MPFIVAAFYHFFDFPNYREARADLLSFLKEKNMKGSLLIASEGINGTLSGTRENIDAVLKYLKKIAGEFEHKESACDTQPFVRAKVRLKKELISLGVKTPSLTLPPNGGGKKNPLPLKGGEMERGQYVEPKDWNALINDSDVLLIDTRNNYETHLGTFENAIDPGIRNFKQLPAYVQKHLDPKKHKKIATFCTGGIRCEKFTAWMIEQGFENVFHLKGGILKYLEDVPPEQSKWQGECYVFDERVAVGHGLVPSSTATMCQACGHALTPQDRKNDLYIEGESCRFCTKGS